MSRRSKKQNAGKNAPKPGVPGPELEPEQSEASATEASDDAGFEAFAAAVDEAAAAESDAESVTESESESESESGTESVTESESESESESVTESPKRRRGRAKKEPAPELESVSAEDMGELLESHVGTLSPKVHALDEDEDEIEIEPIRPGLEKAPPLPAGEGHLKSILESLLFVTDKPMPANRLAKIAHATTKEVQRLLDVLVGEYSTRGIELVEVAGGYQFRSSVENAPFVRELVARKPVRLTRAQIETLSILAYRQPVTRPEIDEVRGVDSGSALKVLMDRGLIKILGRKEEAGRPLLYGTTPHFLEFFGLPSLSDLPTLREYTELSDDSRALFQRRTGESIETLGDINVEARHYSDDDVEAEEALAGRRLHGEPDVAPSSAVANDNAEPEDIQGELSLDPSSEPPPEPSEDDDEDDEDDEDEDEDE
jgi:segregation and condensation protein B